MHFTLILVNYSFTDERTCYRHEFISILCIVYDSLTKLTRMLVSSGTELKSVGKGLSRYLESPSSPAYQNM